MDINRTTLVVMAAGMGSRFGGLKQIEPLGPNGEVILDYSIYDAINAGFDKVVFIIKKEIEKDFRKSIGNRTEKKIDVSYVFQDINNVPFGFNVPIERQKPWGTAHAVMSCSKMVNTPFAVINADDYYGQTSYGIINNHLITANGFDYSMVGFKLENTLTENGTVARGVCEIENGCLKSIIERTKIKDSKFTEDDIMWTSLPQNTIVSMNMWGFTPTIFDKMESGFEDFLENTSDIIKGEYFLPSVVDYLIKNNLATVKVLSSNEKWYGVTYKEDKPLVQKAIKELVGRGLYNGI